MVDTRSGRDVSSVNHGKWRVLCKNLARLLRRYEVKRVVFTEQSKDHLFYTGGSFNFNLLAVILQLDAPRTKLNDTTLLNARRVRGVIDLCSRLKLMLHPHEVGGLSVRQSFMVCVVGHN